ncbi:MAG TPA: pyruvate kinase [Candidatus Binataceae bacterium]|nr:pyruvate kinase [Candidatus Binataceae bacterium]
MSQFGPEESQSVTIAHLIKQVEDLRQFLLTYRSKLQPRLSKLDQRWRVSADNLLHYLALRHRDIRQLQEDLAERGLSSLGRSEAHVVATIDSVLQALDHLGGVPAQSRETTDYPTYKEGLELLATNTSSLLGPPPTGRRVRIMVTMATDCADDYALMRGMLDRGMNCMRINCAHDSPDVWERMIQNLDRARRELGQHCRVLMDLGGPKLRTGPVEHGPQVVVWHPRRDTLGRVTTPAEVWLHSLDNAGPSASGVAQALPLPARFLSTLRSGDRLEFRDARGKTRSLTVAEQAEGGWRASCEQTAYVTPGTRIVRRSNSRTVADEAIVEAVPALEGSLLLHRGDQLVVTAADNMTLPFDVPDAAVVSCTLPEVFSQVRPAQAIWFDDGKIGGIIREANSKGLLVEIQHASAKGSRLRSDKGINLPDSEITLPMLTAKDLGDLRFVAKHADIVGVSFVRSAEDIFSLHARLDELGAREMGTILKIETRQAFRQLPNLILAAMRRYPVGVMIARGDLAVESGYERMAEVQEEILWICEAAHIPVVWATQVLESLAKRGIPSRAEISDAALGERAECVMLNKGPYIVEAIEALDNILRRMEDHQTKKTARFRPLHVSLME